MEWSHIVLLGIFLFLLLLAALGRVRGFFNWLVDRWVFGLIAALLIFLVAFGPDPLIQGTNTLIYWIDLYFTNLAARLGWSSFWELVATILVLYILFRLVRRYI